MNSSSLVIWSEMNNKTNILHKKEMARGMMVVEQGLCISNATSILTSQLLCLEFWRVKEEKALESNEKMLR